MIQDVSEFVEWRFPQIAPPHDSIERSRRLTDSRFTDYHPPPARLVLASLHVTR